MQLKVAKLLNSLLLVIIVIMLGLACGYFYIYKNIPTWKTPYLVGMIITYALLFFLFKWLENNWDKRVITRMAQNGEIALANIKEKEPVMHYHDSSLISYGLYKFTSDILTPDGEVLKDTIFYEKMNDKTEIPQAGTVFVTYSYEKPTQIFIIPTVLISHIPELQPIVTKLESHKNFGIRYLNAYYNKGMVLKTFRESLSKETK